MRFSAEKLRWILLSGAVFLGCALAAIFGLANYHAGQIWRRILARNGVNLRQETNGFTYSQSDGKRTIFTLHAAKAVPHGRGKWSLSDAVLVLYGKDGRTDRIYGSQFEYDQDAGLARAVGEVHMDLQAPPAAGKGTHEATAPDLSFTPGDMATEDPGLIHVRTSGLVYMRKLGVAATPERAEFRYRGLTCTSRGAEFDSGQNVLRLLADVQLEGSLRDQPFRLNADHADLDRAANAVDLSHPLLVTGERNARASHALLHLRPGGSLATGDADGDVTLRSGTGMVSAPQLHGDFDGSNRPQHAQLSGGVRFVDSAATRPAQGSARQMDLDFLPGGPIRTAIAVGDVQFGSRRMGLDGITAVRQLRGERAVANFATAGAGVRRSALGTLRVTGSAEFSGESVSGRPSNQLGSRPGREQGSGQILTRVDADDLLTTFLPGETRTPEPQSIVGKGHTRLEQNGSNGARQLSTADALELRFEQHPAGSSEVPRPSSEVVSVTQTGHVVLRSWAAAHAPTGAAIGGAKTAEVTAAESSRPTLGHAQRAVFQANTGELTLTGGEEEKANIFDGGTQLAAPTLVLHQGTGDAEASGGAVATMGGEGNTPATHVVAARAALLHRAGLSQFFGTDAQPGRLWQGSSQVQAARLVLDGPHHVLSARPEGEAGAVHAVFANGRPTVSSPAEGSREMGTEHASSKTENLKPGESLPEASRDAVEVRAATMDYNDVTREATFSGDVRVRGAEGDITGRHGAAFLASAPSLGKPAAGQGNSPMPGVGGLGGKLERFAILGDVRLTQGGRTGAGDQLTYTAATNSFSLTGSGSGLPRIRDAQQGLVTGATLLFGASDSSIVVAGTPAGRQPSQGAAGKPGRPTRVHTETDLKPPQ